MSDFALNRKEFLSALAAMALLGACGGTSSGSGSAPLRAGSTGQSFPNGFQKDGKLVGFDVETLEAIAKNLGRPLQWVTADFAGLMGQLESSKLDTVANAVAVTEERKQKYDFSVPYSYYGAQIVTHKDNPYTRPEDLFGKTVSAVAGSNNVKNLEKFDKEKKIKIRTYETRDGAEQDCINKRVDGYINSRPVLLAQIKEKNLPLKPVGNPLNTEAVGFPFAKNAEGKKAFDAVDAELQKLLKDGTIKKLSEKYFGEDITVEKK